jgi:hypothetical protein
MSVCSNWSADFGIAAGSGELEDAPPRAFEMTMIRLS